MNQTVLRGFLFCSPAPLPFHSHKEEPSNRALDSPYRDQRQGRAALDARRYRRSSPSKRPRDSSLTSALDSDSDSVLDSTTHFCCGGRKGRNTAQSRTSGSFGLKLEFQYKPQMLCFSKAFSFSACLSKHPTFVLLIGLYKQEKGENGSPLFFPQKLPPSFFVALQVIPFGLIIHTCSPLNIFQHSYLHHQATDKAAN